MADVRAYRSGMLAAMRLGIADVPGVFLHVYSRLGISDTEAMLLIHLQYFVAREGVSFPTPEQIAARMSTSPDRVMLAVERLMRDGLLTIEDEIDRATGVHSERYELAPLYAKLVSAWEVDGESAVRSGDNGAVLARRETAAARRKDLYSVFESEFARPLSPMEYEMIVGWLDADRHSEALILAALKEAVFAGKVHFRYIDKILVEWKKNRIETPEEARAYTERFRGGR